MAVSGLVDLVALAFADRDDKNQQVLILDLIDKAITGVAQLDLVTLLGAMQAR